MRVIRQVGHDSVWCRSWDELRLTVGKHPFLSVVTALYDAVGGWRRGVHEEWRRNILRAVPDHAEETFRPFTTSGTALTPARLALPYQEMQFDVPFDDAMARLRALTVADFQEDLAVYEGRTPEVWQSVGRDFDGWLADFADVVESAWSVLGVVWEHAEVLIDAEVMRAGASAMRQDVRTLLCSLSSDVVASGDTLLMPSIRPQSYEITGRTLTLVPLVSGTDFIAHDLDDPVRSWIAYALPGLESLWPPPQQDAGASARRASGQPSFLEAALGPARAEVVHLLDRPRTMTELATATFRTRSAVTALIDGLIRADLVRREKRGRFVYVSLTRRGATLRAVLNEYSSPSDADWRL